MNSVQLSCGGFFIFITGLKRKRRAFNRFLRLRFRLVSCAWCRIFPGSVRFYDTEQGKELAALAGHPSEIMKVAFSADGKYLASSDFKGAICIWTTASR
jgi:hypothetical protein